MKEYRLARWPDLPPRYHRTAHRRMLSDLSHRHLTLSQLVERSGLRRQEVRLFIEMLDGRGLLLSRERSAAAVLLETLRPLRWLRRTLAPAR